MLMAFDLVRVGRGSARPPRNAEETWFVLCVCTCVRVRAFGM